MGDIYNIFSKQKVDQPRPTVFVERYKQCLKRSEELGYCDCGLCIDKAAMSIRLLNIVGYLCKDYTNKTGTELYVADAMEMVLTVAQQLKKEITNK